MKEVATYRGEKAAASADTRDSFMRKSMTQETNQSPRPLFCTMGCGFYGSARTNGMCSICYNLQRQDSGGTGSDSVPPSLSSLGETLSTHSASAWEESRSESLVTRLIREEETETESGSRVETPGTSQTEQNSDVADSHASAQASTSNLESKPVKLRCFVCRKKVGLTGFDCRCGNMYCSLHRYSDVHNCTFDYKAEGAKKIKKENPVVNGEKIQKF